MTNNNQVNWDEIPEDVEAVVTYPITEDTFFKKIDGKLYSQLWRHSAYKKSGFDKYNEIVEHFGDRFHLRPSPNHQPTPVPPESTQVETSEVENTTTPEFDWSSVEDDVEVVFLHGEGHVQGQQWYKTVDGNVMVRYPPEVIYTESFYTTLLERINDADAVSKCYVRPPAITPPSENVTCKVELDHGLSEEELDLLSRNLTHKEFEWYKKVSAQMREDLIKKATPSTIQTETYTPKPPSILTILQEAQQSILKHHGVTGKVKFTVTCSE